MKRDRVPLLLILSVMLLFAPASGAQTSSTQPEILVIDAAAPAHPFPHFWEHMFGSGGPTLLCVTATARTCAR